MAITSYTTLKSAIADWLLRDDLTAVIPVEKARGRNYK